MLVCVVWSEMDVSLSIRWQRQRPKCSNPSSPLSSSNSNSNSNYRPAVILPVSYHHLSLSLSLIHNHFGHLLIIISEWRGQWCASACNAILYFIVQGLGNNSGDYRKLEQTLKDKYGVPTAVAKVSRLDWLRNAAGLLDPNYWRATLQPTPVLHWSVCYAMLCYLCVLIYLPHLPINPFPFLYRYLKRVHDAVQEAKEELAPAGSTLSLIGHSAGGWLARVYMQEFGHSHISLLLTLGTPHL